jgi:hypothetical protein
LTSRQILRIAPKRPEGVDWLKLVGGEPCDDVQGSFLRSCFFFRCP